MRKNKNYKRIVSVKPCGCCGKKPLLHLSLPVIIDGKEDDKNCLCVVCASEISIIRDVLEENGIEDEEYFEQAANVNLGLDELKRKYPAEMFVLSQAIAKGEPYEWIYNPGLYSRQEFPKVVRIAV